MDRDDAVLWDNPLQCKVFYGQSNDRRFGNGTRHQATPAPAWHQAGRGSASDLTDLEEDKDTLELLPKGCSMVENIGVGHLDQLTGLGVRDLEAAEETGGRPVVEASDSNSYPQPGLPPPASLFFPSVM